MSLETSSGKERATRPVSLTWQHFEIYIFIEYSNLSNVILILCLTTNVDEKEPHIQSNLKSCTLLRTKGVCYCLRLKTQARTPFLGTTSQGHHRSEKWTRNTPFVWRQMNYSGKTNLGKVTFDTSWGTAQLQKTAKTNYNPKLQTATLHIAQQQSFAFAAIFLANWAWPPHRTTSITEVAWS